MEPDKQDLEKRRGQAAGKLLELRTRRGAAVLDGEKFDEGEIGKLEREIIALDEAEAETVRRAREASRWKYQTQCEALRADLLRLESQRLRLIADANIAANTLATSLNDAMATTRQQAEIVSALTGSSPVQMGAPDTVARLSGRLASTVGANLAGSNHRYGNIIWGGASIYQPGVDWAKAEKVLMEPHLEAALKVSPTELSQPKKGNSDANKTGS